MLNEFGQTDNVIDLFAEIKNAYEQKPSLFDEFTKDDLIMAFFPCIRFENQIMLNFRGQNYAMKNWTYQQKMKNCMRLQSELSEMYNLVNMMFIVCLDRGLQLIMENPYSEEHYLRRYWCYPPSIIDRDRSKRGDYFKKPTQYWFVNCEPKNNIINESINNNAIQCKDAIRKMKLEDVAHTGAKSIKVARSMIHPDYANRFIREYILN